MKKSSLNRKFRRALAASLGAVAFASTSCVINAVDPMLYRQRELADAISKLVLPLEITNLDTGVNNIDNAIAALPTCIVNGKVFGHMGIYQAYGLNQFRFHLTWGGIDCGFARLKKYPTTAGFGNFRLMPDDDYPCASIKKIGAAHDLDVRKVNRGVCAYWKTFHDALDTQIKNLEKAEADAAAKRAEENARAERERANSLFSSSGSQPAQIAPTINNTATLAASALATTMIPMTTMMNNTTPVQTTTSSMVNTGNTMGTNADINNINHNANVVEGKTKT